MELTLSKKSLIYKYSRFVGNFVSKHDDWVAPTTICPFFWGTIWNTLASLAICLLIGFFGGAIAVLATSPIWGAIAYFFYGVSMEYMLVGLTIYGMIGIALVFSFIWDKRRAAMYAVSHTVSDGSLSFIGRSFYYLKKRFCPMIKYVD